MQLYAMIRYVRLLYAKSWGKDVYITSRQCYAMMHRA